MNFRNPAHRVGKLAAAAALLVAAGLWTLGSSLFGGGAVGGNGKYDPTALALEEISHRHVRPSTGRSGVAGRHETTRRKASTSRSSSAPKRSKIFAGARSLVRRLTATP